MITHSSDQCKICKCLDSLVTDFQSGTIVCTACGVVQEEGIIDETFEGRVFKEECTSLEVQQTRVGRPTNPYENEADPFKIFVKELKKTAQNLQMRESTIGIANDFSLEFYGTKKNFKGKAKAYLIPAILYITCREQDILETPFEIARKLSLDINTLNNYIKYVKKKTPRIREKMASSNISETVASKCSESSMEDDISKCTKEVSQMICKNEILEGRSSKAIYGCSIYIASKLLNEHLELNQIASMAECSPNTITSAYKKALEYKDYIVPEAYKDKIGSLV